MANTMLRSKVIRRIITAGINISVAWTIFVVGFRAGAQSTAPPRLVQYQHTAWGLKDGAPLWINWIAQTPDGFLWLAAHEGLYRFDGLAFEFYQPAIGPALAAKPATALFVDPGGDLWVGYSDGQIARIRHDVVTSFESPFGYVKASVFRFAMDQDGRLWASTADGLVRLNGTHWEKANQQLGLKDEAVHGLCVDAAGTLWFTTRNAVYSLPRGNKNAIQLDGVALKSSYTIAADSKGRVWVADVGDAAHPLMAASAPAPPSPQVMLVGGAMDLMLDDNGSLWIPTLSHGLRHIIDPQQNAAPLKKDDPAIETFTTDDGLSSNAAFCIFKDREGDIWVGTFNGLDRFRPTDVVPIKFGATLPSLFASIDAHGDPWIASSGLTMYVPASTGALKEFPNHFGLSFNQMLHDANGDMWWANDAAVVHVSGEQQTHIPPPIVPTAEFYIFEDSKGSLNAFVNHRGFFRWQNDQWSPSPGLPQDYPSALSAFETKPGGHSWLGFADGSLRHFFDGQVETVVSAKGPNAGPIRSITSYGNHVWFTGEKGLALYQPGQPLKVIPRTFPKGFLSALETPTGDLWLTDRTRVIQIKADSVRHLLDDPQSGLTDEHIAVSNLFPSVIQAAILDPQQQLWIFSADAMAQIDTTHLTGNTLKPPVVITAINAENRLYRGSGAVLPPQTRNLSIHFAALSFPDPLAVQARYRLDGVDTDWQNSGARRDAFYTNLGPGTYRFHVIASNNDGVWNDQGATIEFKIAPAWFQTAWFHVLWMTVACLLIWVIYRIRVSYIARAISARFDERLDERTRMARELHDTFLQTVQGSKMVADDALDPTADPARMRHALERLSLWLGQAITEGRAALHALRVSTTERNHLAEFLDRIAREQCQRASISVALTVIGDARELHPIVRDEISRIAEEAIRNACTHSKASQLNIELRYADSLHLTLNDNGIGIDPEVIDSGKSGHFGLQGMKERTARIRGRITIASTRNAGTKVTLQIPGDVVYRHVARSLPERLQALLRRAAGVFSPRHEKKR